MKRIIFILIASLLCTMPASARRQSKAKTSNAGTRYLESSFRTYDALQKKIHSLAELGYLEYESSELLARHLEEHGFKVERGVAGIPTAFIASYGSGSPVIGLLAEYDALPGMSQDTVAFKKALVEGGSGHGCGHNLLGTGSVAGAVAISKWLAEGHEGTVVLFGCPAEEGGGGKAYMAREGCFDGVDIVLDWHPDICNLVNTESGLANVQMRFTFHGVSSHASSAPEKGRSALDAVEAFNYMMNMMREHVPDGTRIHYAITDGGKAPNVVPAQAQVLYYLRNGSRAVVADLKDRALKAAEGAALGTGTTMSYEVVSGNFERLYNQRLAEVLQTNLEAVGGVVYDERETEFAKQMLASSGITDESVLKKPETVLPLGCDYPTLKGVSSDVGNVTWVVPVASFRAATFVPAGLGHCWQFTSSGGTTIGTKGVMNVAKVMLYTAYDLYTSPQTVAEVRAEFDEKRGPDFVFEPLIGDRQPPLDYRK
jgi:aminobenzoyl-glutamate utilization protein B